MVDRDAAAYLDWLAASPLTTDGPAGITGHLATDAPDSPHLLADRITAEQINRHRAAVLDLFLRKL